MSLIERIKADRLKTRVGATPEMVHIEEMEAALIAASELIEAAELYVEELRKGGFLLARRRSEFAHAQRVYQSITKAGDLKCQ